ncbi:MAG: HAMP domain-containing protein [Acidobacteria bacterium]|nr:HAMP domain-containing protein [Acidobacteriota bacterium]
MMRLFGNLTSIAGRLKLMNVLVSGSALLLAFASFLAYDMLAFQRDLIHTLRTDAQLIGANTVTALLFDDRQAATQTLEALQGSPEVVAAELLSKDGEAFATYTSPTQIGTLTTRPLAADTNAAHWKVNGDILYGSRILLKNEQVGTLYILARPQALGQRTFHYALIAAIVLLACMGFALLFTTKLRHALTDPLVGLADTAQVVRENKDYSVRAKVSQAHDELTLLVRSFNEMLDDIQQRDKELEQSRHVLEERVQQRTAELSEANKELEAFSYTVAHDLRGPLDSILNLGYLLADEIDGKNPEAAEHLHEISSSAKKMSNLIQDLLNLSRSSRQPSQREMIDLSSMARGILQDLQRAEPERNVQVTIAPGATVLADERLMCIAMENLLGNAWKYTSRLGEAKIEFGMKESGGETIYFVRDNGAGFDPKYIDRLFQPFQRLHVQNEFPGTGVGLATVSRIIARHGGRIWAESGVGKGATFYFTLPYRKGDRATIRRSV